MSGILIDLARRAEVSLQRGSIQEAFELGKRLDALAPQSSFGPFALGVASFKSGRFDAAIQYLEIALARDPVRQNCLFWLANALHFAGRFSEAEDYYREALILGDSAEVRHNLPFLKDDAQRDAAGALLVESNRSCHDDENLRGILNKARELAARGVRPPAICKPASVEGAAAPRISIVTCSIAHHKLASLRRTLDLHLRNANWELIAIPDARSLCEGYERGLARSTGELIVFCHDDIEILCDRFYERLIDACRGVDVVGVCGVTLLNGPALAWAGAPHLHGAVSHPGYSLGDGSVWPTLGSTAGPRVDHAQAMDGLFLAAWRHVAEEIGFDPVVFDGFDFYDIDFTYRAFKKGKRLRIQTDLHLLHQSRGNFGCNYLKYSERFREKHREFKSCTPFVQPTVHEIKTASPHMTYLLNAWVDYWLSSTRDQKQRTETFPQFTEDCRS